MDLKDKGHVYTKQPKGHVYWRWWMLWLSHSPGMCCLHHCLWSTADHGTDTPQPWYWTLLCSPRTTESKPDYLLSVWLLVVSLASPPSSQTTLCCEVNFSFFPFASSAQHVHASLLWSGATTRVAKKGIVDKQPTPTPSQESEQGFHPHRVILPSVCKSGKSSDSLGDKFLSLCRGFPKETITSASRHMLPNLNN